MTTNTEVSTEVTELPSLPVAYQAESLEQLYAKVEAEVKSHVPDIETVEGRKHIKSLAAQISSSKTAIDKPMRDYLREIKALPKVVEKNARESVERFDALKEATLAPLTAAQKPQDDIIARMDEIVRLCSSEGLVSDTVRLMADEAAAVNVETTFWPELIKKARASVDGAVSATSVTLARLVAAEQQAEELERLRKEAEVNAQKERDRQIAEAAAQRAREEEAQRAEQRILDERNKAEQSRLAQLKAEQDAANAEAQRLAQEEQSRINAEKAKLEAQRQAEEAANNAAKYAAEQTALEAQRLKDEEERRANDKAHRVQVNREILAAIITDEEFCKLVAEDKREDVAKAVITLAAKRQSGKMIVNY